MAAHWLEWLQAFGLANALPESDIFNYTRTDDLWQVRSEGRTLTSCRVW